LIVVWHAGCAHGSFVRRLWLLGLAAALSISVLPAYAQEASGDCSTIDFRLANPDPWARVEIGTTIFEGVAMDTTAPEGSVGIERVDFFLGDRNQGGTLVGTATPSVSPEPFGPGSFAATVTMPKLAIGGHDLFVYALDRVTGEESIISQPIAVGVDPSKAFATTVHDPPAQTCVEPPPAEPAPEEMAESGL
jgi:hypothetical protein